MLLWTRSPITLSLVPQINFVRLFKERFDIKMISEHSRSNEDSRRLRGTFRVTVRLI